MTAAHPRRSPTDSDTLVLPRVPKDTADPSAGRPATIAIPTTTTSGGERRKLLDLSATQIMGGALASVTAAFLGARAGVAGTLIGAAFGSVVSAVAGAAYTSSLRRTRSYLTRLPENSEVGWSGEDADTVVLQRVAGPESAYVIVPEPATWSGEARVRPSGGTRPPRRVVQIDLRHLVLTAVLVFAVTIGGVTAWEMLRGEPLSGGTGTTVGRLEGGGAHQRSPSSPPAGATRSTSPSSSTTGVSGSPSSSPTSAATQTSAPSSPTSSAGESPTSSATGTTTSPNPSEPTGGTTQSPTTGTAESGVANASTARPTVDLAGSSRP